MGYYVEITNSDFRLKDGVNPDEVLQHLKDTMLDPAFMESKASGGSWGANGREATWYSWTDTERLRNAATLAEFIGQFLDECEDEGDGRYSLQMNSKTGNEDVLFECIAPYVAPDSVIEWRGEEGNLWAFKFDGVRMRDVAGSVTYDD